MTFFWILLAFKFLLFSVFYEKSYCFYEHFFNGLYSGRKK